MNDKMLDIAKNLINGLEASDIAGVNLTQDETETGETVISISLRMKAQATEIIETSTYGDYYNTN